VTLNPVRCAPALLLFAALCSIPACAHSSSTTVTAVVIPQGRYSELAVREMNREAGRILKRSGISLRSRIGPPPHAVPGLLVVVKLVGQCDMDGTTAYLEPGPLGWSHEVNGDIIPFSDLACENLRGAVEAAIAQGNPLRANVLLGRAMGRVLAHELYHIVGDTAAHAREGVAQPALSPRELTTGQLDLQPADVVAVEKGLNGTR
jgi:hypothetical protein